MSPFCFDFSIPWSAVVCAKRVPSDLMPFQKSSRMLFGFRNYILYILSAL